MVEEVIVFIAALAFEAGYYVFIAAVYLYQNSQSNLLRHRARRAASLVDDGRKQMVRQPITTRKTLYGIVRVSGPITVLHVSSSRHLYLVITLAGHAVQSIDDIYFNDQRIELDDDGVATGSYAGGNAGGLTIGSGRFISAVVKKGLGTTAGDADFNSFLQSEIPSIWTSLHKQEGCAKIAVKLSPDRNQYPTGIPNISAVVHGKTVYDPRTASTAWSANAALCLRDYLTAADGVGAGSGEIDDTAFAAEANIGDESVTLTEQSNVVTPRRLAEPLTAPEIDWTVTGSGSLDPLSNYAYQVTFYDAAGETTVSPASETVYPNAESGRIGLRALALGPSSTTGRKVYRSTNGGAYALAGTLADNTTTTFTDDGAATGAAPPTGNTTEVPDILVRDSPAPFLVDGEPVRVASNLLKYSEQLGHATWSVSSGVSVTDDAAAAPDGATTAEKITVTDATDPQHGQPHDTGAALANRSFVFSVWLWIDSGGRADGHQLLIYDATVGSVFSTDVNGLTTTPQRFSVAGTFPGGETDTSLNVRIDNAQTSNGGQVGDYLYAWGAQLEEAATLGTYVATTGTASTLPAPLVAGTTYYYIYVDGLTGKLATTRANALAGTAITRTAAGTGTQRLTRLSESRYELHGLLDSADTPRTNLEAMLTACGGKLANPGGVWTLFSASYRAPTVTLDESDLDGPIKVTTRLSKRELANAVKGVFIDPAASWQPTDYPPVTNATYLAEDNSERLWRDLELPFTVSVAAAQRLAKIELERNRQQISTHWPCQLTALRVQVGDVVNLTNTRFGWSAKPFEISDLRFVVRAENEAPRLGLDLTLRETASAVYDWNDGEEMVVDPAPNTDLPDPFDVAALAGFSAASGTDHLYVRADGTVFSRVFLSWTASPDGRVSGGGAVEIQYRHAASTAQEWEKAATVPGDAASAYVLEVEDGEAYYFRVRAVSTIGVRSDWSTLFHVVIGKTEPPAAVTGLTATDTILHWSPNADLDLQGYVVRYRTDGGSDWNTATPAHGNAWITDAQLDTRFLVGSTVKMLVKALDTSGHESATAASHDLDLRPATPTQFSITRQADGTREFVFALDPAPADLDGFVIRYYLGTTSDWSAMTALHTGVLKVSPFETNQLAAGTYTFACKAVDLAGNESAAATFITTVTIGDPRIAGALEDINEQTDGWPGTKTSCHVDAVPNILVADGTGTWTGAPATWAGFTDWNMSPVSPISYVRQIDIGVVTTFTPLVTVLADGSQTIEEQHSDDDVTYSSYAAVSGAVTARYIRIKVTITGAYPVIYSMRTILLGTAVTDYINDQDSSALTGSYRIGTGDVRIPLTQSFSVIKSVGVSLQNVGAGWSWELIDKTPTYGPRIKIYDNTATLADCTFDADVDGIQ